MASVSYTHLDVYKRQVIKTATTYVLEGNISDEEFEQIKNYCINPVDSRETGLEKPETLVTEFEVVSYTHLDFCIKNCIQIVRAFKTDVNYMDYLENINGLICIGKFSKKEVKELKRISKNIVFLDMPVADYSVTSFTLDLSLIHI